LNNPKVPGRGKRVNMPMLDKTINAIAEAFVQQLGPPADTAQTQIDHIGKYLSGQVNALPDFLRFPFKVLTVLFDWAPLLKWGRTFHGCPLHLRQRHLIAWKDSALGPLNDLVHFYESLTMLAYYDFHQATRVL